jgi:hypothetical protein
MRAVNEEGLARDGEASRRRCDILHRRKLVSSSAPPLDYKFRAAGKSKDERRAARRKVGVDAWLRLDGFGVRPCKVIDLSDTGVRISLNAPQAVPNIFVFLSSRGSGPGRRASVKWRRGTQIGADFL